MDPGLLTDFQSYFIRFAHERQQIGRYGFASVFCLQFLEWFTCFSDEVELIHQARWTSMKFAYLFCRYYPIITFPFISHLWLQDHTLDACRKLTHVAYALIIPCHVSAQAVILYRAYAFTGRHRLVFFIFAVCFLAQLGVEVWLFAVWFTPVKELFVALGQAGCYGAEPSHFFDNSGAITTGVVVLGAFALDVIATLAVIVHCIQIRSTQGPLGKEFIKQGLVAFVVTAVLNLVTAVTYIQPARMYSGVSLPFAIGLPLPLACRLILSLRRRVTPTETFELREQSRIVRRGLAPYQQRHHGYESCHSNEVDLCHPLRTTH